MKPLLSRASTYEELWGQLDFRTMQLPAKLNMGVACLDDQDPDARAMTTVAPDRSVQHYTFADVAASANRLANALRAQGIRPGDVVGIVNPQSFETGVAFVALWRMGAISLPLSSLFGADALRFRLRDGHAKAVISSSENAPKVRAALRDSGGDIPVFLIGDEPQAPGEFAWAVELNRADATFSPIATSPSDPAILLYTSGTTGNPKGVLQAHRLITGHSSAFETIYDFYPRSDDVLWSPADWAWTGGLLDVLMPAWLYGLPVIVDRAPRFSPERAVWLLREFNVTLTFLPATVLRMIRAQNFEAGGFSLRALFSAGETLGADLLEWTREFFDVQVNEGYGQTEINMSVGNCASVFPVRPGSMGRPLPGTRVAVLNEEGQPVINELGELAVDRNHPNAMLGYFNNPDATQDKYVGDWLLSGDLCRQDDDGYIWFVSRKDDVFKSSGFRIGPGEIEDCLGSHAAVAMAAVIGVPDARRGAAPRAFVVLRPGYDAGEELQNELRDHVRAHLAVHEVPRDIIFRDDLPRTATGKILRRELHDD